MARRYTQEQELLPEIKAMLTEGRSQREIAEHLGLRDKTVVKDLKWVTDIAYIHTDEGIIYLSMIRDLYDNSIVAYKTAVQQTVSLVLDTIRLAMKAEKKRVAVELQLHSGQGFQYTSQGYFNLTQEYGITPSMSRRGNCYDNAMAENFFSILKTECIYRQKIRTFQQAKELIDDFIYFYNYERIQLKTGETPLAQRLSA